jgi:hypothetical protein
MIKFMRPVSEAINHSLSGFKNRAECSGQEALIFTIMSRVCETEVVVSSSGRRHGV